MTSLSWLIYFAGVVTGLEGFFDYVWIADVYYRWFPYMF